MALLGGTLGVVVAERMLGRQEVHRRPDCAGPAARAGHRAAGQLPGRGRLRHADLAAVGRLPSRVRSVTRLRCTRWRSTSSSLPSCGGVASCPSATPSSSACMYWGTHSYAFHWSSCGTSRRRGTSWGSRWCSGCASARSSRSATASTCSAKGVSCICYVLPTVLAPGEHSMKEQADICGHCGHQSPAESRFCAACGRPVVRSSRRILGPFVGTLLLIVLLWVGAPAVVGIHNG